MKYLAYLMTALLLIATAEAKPRGNKDESLRKFEEANKNHDSSLTKSEIADMLGL